MGAQTKNKNYYLYYLFYKNMYNNSSILLTLKILTIRNLNYKNNKKKFFLINCTKILKKNLEFIKYT